MLDCVAQALTRAGHPFVRLDGSMALAKRDACITKFNTSGSTNVFLISLKVHTHTLTSTNTHIHTQRASEREREREREKLVWPLALP